MSSPERFAADISEFVKRTRISGGLVLKKLAFDALRGIVMMTPVDTGRARGNWRVSINTIDKSTSEARKDKAGHTAVNTGNAVLTNAKWGDTIYISNNLPYIRRLEDGWSKQAPAGMMGVTFNRLRTGLARALASVRRGGGT